MGTLVYSLLWVMQDLNHQQYYTPRPPQTSSLEKPLDCQTRAPEALGNSLVFLIFLLKTLIIGLSKALPGLRSFGGLGFSEYFGLGMQLAMCCGLMRLRGRVLGADHQDPAFNPLTRTRTLNPKPKA